jgi:hypothetical protein
MQEIFGIQQPLYFQQRQWLELTRIDRQTVARDMQIDRRANCSPSIDDLRSGHRSRCEHEAGRRELL